jgi:hypothetical protein
LITSQDIEGYLIKMGVSYDEIATNTWMIRDNEDHVDNLVVTFNEPVVVFSVKLADIPDGCDRLSLYEELLKLNAREMLHGAYGLEGNSVVATDTLQAENLDFNEFQASVDALNLSLTTHYRRLAPFFGRSGGGAQTPARGANGSSRV